MNRTYGCRVEDDKIILGRRDEINGNTHKEL